MKLSEEEVKNIITYLNSLPFEKKRVAETAVNDIISKRKELDDPDLKHMLTYVYAKYGANKVTEVVKKVYNSVPTGIPSTLTSKANLMFALLHTILYKEGQTKELGVVAVGRPRPIKLNEAQHGTSMDFAFWFDNKLVTYTSFDPKFQERFLRGDIPVGSKIKLLISQDKNGKLNIVENDNQQIELLDEKLNLDRDTLIKAIVTSPNFYEVSSPLTKLLEEHKYAYVYCQGLVGANVDKFSNEFTITSDEQILENVLISNDGSLQQESQYLILGTIFKSKQGDNTYIIRPLVSVNLDPELVPVEENNAVSQENDGHSNDMQEDVKKVDDMFNSILNGLDGGDNE